VRNDSCHHTRYAITLDQALHGYLIYTSQGFEILVHRLAKRSPPKASFSPIESPLK